MGILVPVQFGSKDFTVVGATGFNVVLGVDVVDVINPDGGGGSQE